MIDPVTGVAIAGMIASPIVTGLMGRSAAKDAAGQAAAARKQAQENIEAAVKYLESIGVPSVEAQQIILQQPELVGLLTAEQLGPSAMEGISTDPSLGAAQKAALTGLRERSVSGLTPEDLAQFENIRGSLMASRQSQDAGILQSMAERGQSGSGGELAARLNASQQGNQQALNQGNMLAAQSAQAKREALASMGGLAGQMRDQSFGEQERISKAKDLINQFNIQTRQNVGQQNLQARQALSDSRVGIGNQ